MGLFSKKVNGYVIKPRANQSGANLSEANGSAPSDQHNRGK